MEKRRLAGKAFLALMLAAATPLAAHDLTTLPRTVSVTGEGEVAAEPDRARLVLGVDQLSPDVVTAETEVNKVVRTYLAEARTLGAADKDIQTTGVSIHPEYNWDEKRREQKLAGYRVRREIVVLVRDLDRLGDFILRATRAGVNQVQPPALESSKSVELKDQALARAAEDARRRASLLARTLGAKLGTVRNVSSHEMQPEPPVMMKAMGMGGDAMQGNAEMGIQAGEIRYRTTVHAEFDLQP